MEITSEIARQKTMQLATEKDGQPWICTVYFVLHDGNFYWLSFPERRHSAELAENPRAAITVAIKRDVPVIGVQVEGEASVVENMEEIETILSLYVEKYGQGNQFVELYKTGKNHHVLYRFSPRKTILFDELNHPENPQREITLLIDK